MRRRAPTKARESWARVRAENRTGADNGTYKLDTSCTVPEVPVPVPVGTMVVPFCIYLALLYERALPVMATL